MCLYKSISVKKIQNSQDFQLPKPGPRFVMSYSCFFTFDELRWEGVVRFTDIDGIGDHQCLHFFLQGIIQLLIIFEAKINFHFRAWESDKCSHV
jgi:hypothetical protein